MEGYFNRRMDSVVAVVCVCVFVFFFFLTKLFRFSLNNLTTESPITSVVIWLLGSTFQGCNGCCQVGLNAGYPFNFNSLCFLRSFVHFQSYKSFSDKSGIFPDLASTTSLMFGRGSMSSNEAPSLGDDGEYGQ